MARAHANLLARECVTHFGNQEFLVALRGGQTVSDACKTADLVRQTVYKWRDAEPDFAADWAVSCSVPNSADERNRSW